MAEQRVQVNLEVQAQGRNVTAKLTFRNAGGQDAFIERVNACDGGRIRNDLFEITRDDQRVPYIGRLAKRAAPGPEDFIKVAPGHSLSNTVQLDSVYQFPPGPGTYTVRYSALNPYPDRDGFFELVSNEAVFTLKA